MHVCVRVCFCVGVNVGVGVVKNCISIQQLLPRRRVWEVGRKEGGGGWGKPSPEQNGAMGWNKAARREAA